MTLCRPGAAVHEDGDVPGQDDVEALDDGALGGQDFAFVEVPQRAVRGEPREFLAWRGAERLVLGQLFDQVGV